MSITITRQPRAQTFFNVILPVLTTPTQIAGFDINTRIQSFIVCNPSVNANSVFFGDSQVSPSSAGPVVGSGLELQPGSMQAFAVLQDRQTYELQDPLNQIASMIAGNSGLPQSIVQPVSIPLIVWDMRSCYLIAAVATSVAVCFFKNVYS